MVGRVNGWVGEVVYLDRTAVPSIQWSTGDDHSTPFHGHFN